MTVEEGAELVCEGNNTSNQPRDGDSVSSFGGVFKSVAEEIKRI